MSNSDNAVFKALVCARTYVHFEPLVRVLMTSYFTPIVALVHYYNAASKHHTANFCFLNMSFRTKDFLAFNPRFRFPKLNSSWSLVSALIGSQNSTNQCLHALVWKFVQHN